MRQRSGIPTETNPNGHVKVSAQAPPARVGDTADFFDSDKVRENVNARFRTKIEGTLERFKNGDYGGA
jgi:hypothetical protein